MKASKNIQKRRYLLNFCSTLAKSSQPKCISCINQLKLFHDPCMILCFHRDMLKLQFKSTYHKAIKVSLEVHLTMKNSLGVNTSFSFKIIALRKIKHKLSYFSTIGKPYWRDNGSTPTALQTALKLTLSTEHQIIKHFQSYEPRHEDNYHYSDHQPNPKMQKHQQGQYQTSLLAA